MLYEFAGTVVRTVTVSVMDDVSVVITMLVRVVAVVIVIVVTGIVVVTLPQNSRLRKIACGRRWFGKAVGCGKSASLNLKRRLFVMSALAEDVIVNVAEYVAVIVAVAVLVNAVNDVTVTKTVDVDNAIVTVALSQLVLLK